LPTAGLGSMQLQKECAHAACEFEEAPI